MFLPLFLRFFASANVVAEGIMFPEYSCVRASVSLEQTLLMEFDQTLPLTDFGARMNASDFGVKRSRVKVMVGSI